MRRTWLRCALVVLMTAAAAALTASPASGGGYGVIKKFGSSGKGPGQFTLTSAIDTAPNGDVYVGDYSTGRILVFSSTGDFRFSFVTPAGDDAFPKSIAVDPNGLVYVQNFGKRDTIDVFTAAGTFVSALPFNHPVTGTFLPEDIATDPSGNIWISADNPDSDPNSRILQFSPAGELLGQWPMLGSASQITVDTKGFVYAGDAKFQINKFTGTGTLVTSWGSENILRKPAPNKFHSVSALDVGPNGSIYVLSVDRIIESFQEFDPSGAFLGLHTGTIFQAATDLAVGPSGVIYVGDEEHVKIFRPQPAPPKVKRVDGRTRKRKMSIKFSGFGAVRFECKLTGAGVPKGLKRWRGCRSPKRYAGLKPGGKVFQVRGVDAAGVRGEPATKKWVIIARGRR